MSDYIDPNQQLLNSIISLGYTPGQAQEIAAGADGNNSSFGSWATIYGGIKGQNGSTGGAGGAGATSDGNGNAGTQPAGGGGGAATTGVTDRNGGKGGDGQIIVITYF